VIGVAADFARDGCKRKTDGSHAKPTNQVANGDRWSQPITAPATPEAQQWDGWGTALKPASENWILCRKPIEGTIAGNVLEWGVGALNIDGCRVAGDVPTTTQGRFPANLLLSHSHDCDDSGCGDGCPVKALDEQTGDLKSGGHWIGEPSDGYGGFGQRERYYQKADSGGASRYFPNFGYYPKASKRDRTCNGKAENNHPTVKNRDLMRWLCRLITPPGGPVLDCFAGRGSTAIACLEEGFNCILIEQDAESVKTAKDRAAAWLKENRPEPTIEQRLTWLETKVQAIDCRTRKQKVTTGQLSLFLEVAS
jgi:site-specific DNA-methyltransferase (adenine-specific)